MVMIRCLPGFEPVAEEFERNFSERGETGAAFAVNRGDDLIVDLWGGLADRDSRRPWNQDTLQLIFSGTKGLVSLCMLILADRQQLDLDAPVASCWSEFAGNGKGAIRIRHVLTQTAGLPGLREPVSMSEFCDADKMAERLAAERPFWPAGQQLCYHPFTFGWLCHGLVRAVDGRSIGEFFADEVAAPLGLETWIGLPEELEDRVSTLEAGPRWADEFQPTQEQLAGDPVAKATWGNPFLFSPDRLPWNQAEVHRTEVPGANGISTARSMASLYASLVNARSGTAGLLSPVLIEQARELQEAGLDPLMREPVAYGLGFELQTELAPFGPSREAFGFTGVGGSVHGAWPEHGVGFSYSMNQLRGAERDERPATLLRSLWSCLNGEQ
jgi:CubicO group peptidase (beta-lactamase class C family)